jgi:ABC-type molybdenum transport system ATPase subunit/photorepair protein PhrA
MGEQMTSLLNTDNLSVSIAGKSICQELNWQVKPDSIGL